VRGNLWIAALPAAVLLSACGDAASGTTPDAVPASAAAGQERVVEFWYMPNGTDPADHLRAEIERFEAANPGVRIEPVELAWESALTRIITAASSGAGPDVVQLGTTWVPGIAELGALATLSEDEIDTIGGRDAFVDASWTSTSIQDSAETVAVPWFLDTRAGFYRTDLFDELGLDPAEAFADWDAFEATLQAIRDDGTMHPLAVAGANDWNVVHDLAPWIWANGGGFLSPEGDAPAIALPETVDGIDAYQHLVATYNHPGALTLSAREAQQLFVDGEAAITFGDPSVVEAVRSSDADGAISDDEWTTVPFPRGPAGRHAFLGGSNLALFENSTDLDAGRAWVQFLTSEESQLRYTRAVGMLPARQSALADDSLSADAGYRPFVEQLADGRQYPPLPAWLHVEVALQHHLGSMWQAVASSGALDREDLDERMRAAAEDIEEVLSGDG
jgi:multiple sugar transport system substrate-binding protein